jgi:hypothetical protein
MKFAIATSLLVVTTALCYASHTRAATVGVRFTEGVAHGFPVLRSVEGEQLAAGEFTQIARDDLVESRFVFRFHDGSLYEETVVFSQRSVFQLEHYRIVQRGRSFPETLEASIDRSSGRYDVRYRADEDALEERLSGRFTLPEDVYSGMLGTLMKNVAPGESDRSHPRLHTAAARDQGANCLCRRRHDDARRASRPDLSLSDQAAARHVGVAPGRRSRSYPVLDHRR